MAPHNQRRVIGQAAGDACGSDCLLTGRLGWISDKTDIGEEADLGANNPVFVDNPIRW